MPHHIVSILRDLYHEDEYKLLDGDKRANLQPFLGVKQGCPLSPLLFSIYMNDIDCLVEGVQGALTGIPNFMVTHLLFADDLSHVQRPYQCADHGQQIESLRSKEVVDCQHIEI